MGNIKNLISMIPGMGKMARDLDIDDQAFDKISAIIYSMTPAERANPGLMNGSRKKRIALGSGHKIDAVNQFIRQFEQMREMMFKMSNMSGKQGLPGGKFPKMPGLN
jgi:signal recognition particle subunit SRP54